MIKNITAVVLKEWLDKNLVTLIDVREPSEYNAEHIAEAVLMPLATITQSKLSEYANKKLVFQCRSGKRGAIACDKVANMGLNTEIYNLDGGIMAWSQAGLKVQINGKAILPLDRQVQLTIGICVLISGLLGYFYTCSFSLLSALIGIGLIFAGITGFCGLARALALMPWNK